MKKKTKNILTALICVIIASSLCSCVFPIPRPEPDDTSQSETTAYQTVDLQTADLDRDNAEFSPRVPEGSMPFYNVVSRYAWSILSDENKRLYYDILEAALSYKSSVAVSGAEAAAYVYECVFFDCPELFYLEETATYENGSLVFGYAFDRGEAEQIAEGLEQAYEEFLAGVTPDMTDYDKLFYLYEYIINRTKYAEEEGDDYDNGVITEKVRRASCAAGPLIDRRSICIGYARATQYLALRLGIRTFTVRGFGNGGDHYYSLVLLDDGYYYVDTTWGDPVGEDRSIDYLTYYYFCITTEELLRSHEIRTNVPLPECTNMKYNYYVYNGLYTDDALKFADMTYKAFVKGDAKIQIKVDHDRLDEFYDEVKVAVIERFDLEGAGDQPMRIGRSDGPSLITVFFS
ncbi:MAG: hypothetical protein J5879_09310 [Clostridia bacterium]|nr:hypothetical protein [Clostridia bacterium]